MIKVNGAHVILKGSPVQLCADITTAMNSLLISAEKRGQREIMANMLAMLPQVAGLSKEELESATAVAEARMAELKSETATPILD